ncbi:hypothetical protein RFI_30650, partial [Reticulomyxa filosa]
FVFLKKKKNSRKRMFHFENEAEWTGCFKKKWVLSSRNLESYTCQLCKEIANDGVELDCPDHEEDENIYVYGKQCLLRYLESNNGKCPINNHDDCEYLPLKHVQDYVEELLWICPRQKCKREGRTQWLREHFQSNCEFVASPLQSCKFKDFGCDVVLYQKTEWDRHMRSSIHKHLTLVVNEIHQLQDQHCLKMGANQ